MSIKISEISTELTNISATAKFLVTENGTTKYTYGYTIAPKRNISAIVDPTVANDSSEFYSVGSTWVNTVSGTVFTCLDSSSGSAIWKVITISNVEIAAVAPTVSDDALSGFTVSSRWFDTVADKEYVCLDSTPGAAVWVETTAGAGGGETNTASNVGTAGVGVFKQKTGVNLEFKNINAGSAAVIITDDTGDNEIDIDIDQTQIDHTQLQNIGTNSHADIDTHLANTSNPHSVTKAQVGLSVVENLKVNLSGIVAPGVSDDSTADYSVGSRWIDTVAQKEYVAFDVSVGAAVWIETTNVVGTGEANTASNVGTAGVGVFKQKTGVDLEFKNINAGSAAVTITDDTGDNEIDIDIDQTQIDHTQLQNIGTNSHSDIDTHLANTSNPHSVTKSQVGLGNVVDSKVNFGSIINPSVTDDSGSGYDIGSRWINTVDLTEFVCVDASTGAAVWSETTGDFSNKYSDADIGQTDYWKHFQSSENILFTPILDATDDTTPAQAVIAMPSGVDFYPTQLGIIVTAAAGTNTLLEVKFGDGTTLDNLAVSTLVTITTVGQIQFISPLTSSAKQNLSITVSVASDDTTPMEIRGFFKGISVKN